MAGEFKGKNILVTGAGAGIGKAICERLSKLGAQVIGLSLLKNELDALQNDIPGIRTIQADLQNWTETKKALENIGPIDALVNNAGVAIITPFLEIKPEEFDKTFAINVKSYINVGQIAAKSMIERKVHGVIINIASVAAKRALQDHTVYCSSKAAVEMLTKVMGLELGPYGIRANAISPTVVMTDLGRSVWSDPQKKAELIKQIPCGRFAEVDEVVDKVLFLLSDASSMITCQSLLMDGGFCA